jgi:hypothetical protein
MDQPTLPDGQRALGEITGGVVSEAVQAQGWRRTLPRAARNTRAIAP